MEHDRVPKTADDTDSAAENEQLREALCSRPVIDQAKGMVMLVRGWPAARAFAALVTVSQHCNVKLRDVATVVVAAGSHAEPGLADRETERAVLAAVRVHVFGTSFE
ncbi:ANTAR domain-containing protein [Amycolatopsis sp. cmx-4-68]|uniref:ANTAR domain-containing protein n=1 Tax=Amycolatopsis sp. cmx-4-68 TaxID=2790938 RepID=UPI00397BC33F